MLAIALPGPESLLQVAVDQGGKDDRGNCHIFPICEN